MPTLNFPKQQLEYQIKFSSRRKTIGIAVDKEHGLVVTAPTGTSPDVVQGLVSEKMDWIKKSLDKVDQILPPANKKFFVSGERLLYLGRSYRLEVIRKESKRIRFRFYHGRFIVEYPREVEYDSSRVRRHVVRWYREKALEKLSQRVTFYAAKVGKVPEDVRVRDFKSRWGSCQVDGALDFNWRIIMAPMSIVDYLVVHELVHLIHRGHSRRYWSRLSAILLDHKRRKDWLRINGATLSF